MAAIIAIIVARAVMGLVRSMVAQTQSAILENIGWGDRAGGLRDRPII